MPLNTLHFCTSEAWGGREMYAGVVMSELKKAGCGVFAVCKPGSPLETFSKEQEIPCINLPSDARLSISSIKRIKSFVRQENIDVLHAHYSKNLWQAALALMGNGKQKLFFTNYNGGRKKKDIFHRIIYRRIDGVFTSSAKLAWQLVDMYPVPASKIHLLPYGKRTEEYMVDENKRAEIRARYRVKNSDILIGTIVRIDPQKGPFDLVKSLLYIDKKLQEEVKIMIVGEVTRKATIKPGQSPFEPKCEAYFNDINAFIEENGFEGKVIFTGFQTDVVGHLGAMDVFVFPSHNELYALSVIEAMFMKLPVVATRAGGNLEQIKENETGFFYEVGNSRDLAEKISLYIENPEMRKMHGEKARCFVEKKHNMHKMIETLMNYYKNNKRTTQG